MGGVANDKVFNNRELFFDGLIDKTEAINRLRYEKAEPANMFPHRESNVSVAFEGVKHYDCKSDFCFRKNIAVLSNVLLNSRDFHWMRHWISFIIPRSTS